MGVHVLDWFRALMGDVSRVTAHWAPPDAVPLCPGGELKDYTYRARALPPCTIHTQLHNMSYLTGTGVWIDTPPCKIHTARVIYAVSYRETPVVQRRYHLRRLFLSRARWPRSAAV